MTRSAYQMIARVALRRLLHRGGEFCSGSISATESLLTDPSWRVGLPSVTGHGASIDPNGASVPISDPTTCSKSARTVWLLNQLVRADEHRRWDGDPERLRGLQVYEEFEMCRLLYRQVRRLGTFENLVDIDSSTPCDRF